MQFPAEPARPGTFALVATRTTQDAAAPIGGLARDTLTTNVKEALPCAALKITILPPSRWDPFSVGIAQAHEPDTARVGEDIVLQCSEAFGPGSPGTIVFTPSGMFDASCHP